MGVIHDSTRTSWFPLFTMKFPKVMERGVPKRWQPRSQGLSSYRLGEPLTVRWETLGTRLKRWVCSVVLPIYVYFFILLQNRENTAQLKWLQLEWDLTGCPSTRILQVFRSMSKTWLICRITLSSLPAYFLWHWSSMISCVTGCLRYMFSKLVSVFSWTKVLQLQAPWQWQLVSLFA